MLHVFLTGVITGFYLSVLETYFAALYWIISFSFTQYITLLQYMDQVQKTKKLLSAFIKRASGQTAERTEYTYLLEQQRLNCI